MNKLTLALLASAAALAIAPAAMATTFTYTTSGLFEPSGTSAVTFGSVGNTSTLTYDAGSGTLIGTPSFTSGGSIVTTATGLGANVSGTFALTITQTAPGPGSGIIDSGTLSGLVTTNSSGVSVVFANTTLDLDGVFYTVDPLTVNLVAPNTNTGAGLGTSDIVLYVTTPEPSSLMLLGTGLLGLAFVAFRKAKSSGMVLSM